MFPNSTFDIQPLPGHGSAFVGIISGHHGVARSGRMIIFDPTKGRKSTAGMVQEIPHRNRPIKEEIKDELVNGVWPQFIKPTPLNDKYFLGCAKLDPGCFCGDFYLGGRLRQCDLSDAGRRRRLYQPDPGAMKQRLLRLFPTV